MKGSRLLLLLILLVAAGLRLVELDGLPPGLEHDEVANWLIDRDILAGQHGIYFEKAYGHEATYHYLQAAALALFGDHVFSLRLPSVFAGLLGLAISYALARKLFGERVALVNGALLAVLFWPLFFSRLGVRAITLPAVSGLAAWFFWVGFGKEGRSSSRSFALAGALAGASLYTYMAARSVPLIFGLFVLYLLAFHRSLIRRHWRNLLLFFLLMLVVAAPLAYWLLTHPGAEYRIGEINQPLNALLAGDWRPVASNGLGLLNFFGWRGDPLIRQNIPGRPVFDPLGAILFYAGLALALWRWRRPETAFVLIWLAVSLSPSLVTADAPSSIRCINALLVVGIPVGLAAEGIGKRWGIGKLVNGGLALWLVLVAVGTARDYWRWGQEKEVRFVWQTALWEAAAALDADPDSGPVVVAGWTPESMDPPTMELFLQRDDLSLRYVDPGQALLAPRDGARMVRPAVLPLDPLLAAELARWGGVTQEHGAYTLARVPAFEQGCLPSSTEGISSSVAFEGNVTFLGHRVAQEGAGIALLTYWRADGPVLEPLRIFVHLVDDAGEIVGQDDGLGAPTAHWQEGDLILQVHRVPLPAGVYGLQVGLYNPITEKRWLYPTKDGSADSMMLERVTVP